MLHLAPSLKGLFQNRQRLLQVIPGLRWRILASSDCKFTEALPAGRPAKMLLLKNRDKAFWASGGDILQLKCATKRASIAGVYG
jgi:hypothetical protein